MAINHRGERHNIARAWRYDALGRYTTIVGVEHDGVTLIARTRDGYLSRCVYAQESFDLEFMDAAICLVRAECGESLQGRTFLDIGANIGTSAVTAIVRFGADRVIAIEPEPHNAALLRANFALNHLHDHVVVHEVGVADQTTAGRLALSTVNSGDHQVSADSTRTGIEIHLRRLDEIDIDFDQVGLVWMDVQGHEGHVFAGAGTLLDHIPIVTEFWWDALSEHGGLELMSAAMRRRSGIIDIRATMLAGEAIRVAPDEVDGYVERMRHGNTDLLLLPVA